MFFSRFLRWWGWFLGRSRGYKTGSQMGYNYALVLILIPIHFLWIHPHQNVGYCCYVLGLSLERIVLVSLSLPPSQQNSQSVSIIFCLWWLPPNYIALDYCDQSNYRSSCFQIQVRQVFPCYLQREYWVSRS
jgi:hypothetical protein